MNGDGVPKKRREVPVLFLDLDGTVREGKDDALGRFVNGPEDVRVFPEAVVMIERWRQRGGRVVAVTNQGGIALGLVPAHSVLLALEETQRQCDGMIDVVTYCPHHPDAATPEKARCWCRKPSPGMLIHSVSELHELYGDEEVYPVHLSLMVGDRPEDEQCAKLAGADFMWASAWRRRAVS